MSYRESHFDKAGSDYDAFLSEDDFSRYMALRESAVLERLVTGLARKERYLDFACGTGRAMEVVAPHFFEVVGVDISEKMAAVAKTRVAKASFHIGDLTAEDAALGQFDLITAFRFFGNAEDALRQQVLRILRAKIRSDGWLIINNHRNPSAIRCKLSGETAGMDLTHKKLTRFLADAGFRVEKAIPIGLWMLRHRWSDRRYWNGPAGSLADRLTAIPWLVPWSPDAVIAARPMPAS